MRLMDNLSTKRKGVEVKQNNSEIRGETKEETHSLGVGEGPQSVIILLSSRIPKTQVNRLAINHHIGWVVVKSEK